MKNFFRSTGYVLLFLAAQLLGTFGIIIWRLRNDTAWAKQWLDLMYSSDTGSEWIAGYMSVMSEIILPCLILAKEPFTANYPARSKKCVFGNIRVYVLNTDKSTA